MKYKYCLVFLLTSCILLIGIRHNAYCRTDKAAQIYLLGQKAYDDGLWDLAIQQLSNYISDYPNASRLPYAYFLKAEAFVQKKQYKKAIVDYRKIVKKYPRHELSNKAWYRLGFCNYKLKKYAPAEAAYEHLRTAAPGSIRDKAMFGLAESQYAQAKYKSAAKTYQQIIQQSPAHIYKDLVLYGIAWSNFNIKNYKKAASALERLLRKFPKASFYDDALFLSAQAYYQLKNYSQAAGSYKKFIRKYKNDKRLNNAVFSCAYSYYKAGDYKSATDYFIKLIKKNKGKHLAEGRFYLGEARYQLGNYKLALINYQLLLKDYPKHRLVPIADYNQALCYLKLNQLKKAALVFRNFIDKYPKNKLVYSAWLNLGRLRFDYKDYIRAQEAFRSAMRSKNGAIAAQAAYWLGETLAQEGKFKKALIEFQKAAKYKNAGKWRYLADYQAAQIYIQQDKIKDARYLLVKISKQKNNP